MSNNNQKQILHGIQNILQVQLSSQPRTGMRIYLRMCIFTEQALEIWVLLMELITGR